MSQLFIETVDDQLLFERIESFAGGMDAFTRSTLLPVDTCQYLENCVLDYNMEARTRPGADPLGARTVDNGANATLQGLIFFDKPGLQRILTAKGGGFWQWDNSAWTAVTGWTIDPSGSFSAAQGVDTLLLTDNVNPLQVWDGSTFTQVNPGPTGATVLTWAVGRMFAAGFPGTGGTGMETDALWASNLLEFGSTGWLKQNSIRVGAGEGDPIVAVATLATSALTSYLVAVLKQNSVWLVNADPTQAPANWQVLLIGPGTGILGKRAFCQFGNDLLIFCRDGVRSVRRMQSAAGQYELAPPISLPMQPYIDRINWSAASGICATKYKELALFAVPLDNSTVNNYLLVFNGRLQKWAGIWTGWTPVGLAVSRFNAVQQLNIADTNGYVNYYKDLSSREQLGTYTDNGANIGTKIWTRSATFGDLINPKDGYYAEARFTDGNAVINLSAVADNLTSRTWQTEVTAAGPTLPVALNFVLGQGNPWTVRRSLRGLSDFAELYLKVESSQGWFSARNITMAAFLNMLDNQ